MILGAQLYTLRDFCKNTDDLADTLKKVADIGYTSVQLSGICAYEPEWMKQQLKTNGLIAPLTHYNPDRIANDTQKVIEEHNVFDCNYIGIGCSEIYKSKENLDAFVQKYSEPAKMIKQSGKRLMYHNHNLEFNKYDGADKIVLEMLCDAFPADELGITLDTFWVQAGGGDVIWWINKLSGRTPCIHLKDLAYRPGTDLCMMPIGSGNMNFEGIIKACFDNNVEHVIVEQDVCNGRDPFECLNESFNYLKSLGL